jgi:anaerobic ribonucleoside-triphosphate reductase
MYCDKCGNKIQEFNGELLEAKCLKFKDGEEEYTVVRCDKCFAKDQSLTNFRKTETYSRVVGYMRPVQQWNKGKQEEYKDRKEFKEN